MFGIPIPFTVLKGHDYVEDLLERDELVNVQLPQKFDRASADRRPRGRPARRRVRSPRTPACSTATPASAVRILPGSERNIKITLPTDIVTAEAIYADAIGRGG